MEIHFSKVPDMKSFSPDEWEIKVKDYPKTQDKTEEGIKLKETTSHFALRCFSDFCCVLVTFGQSKPENLFERKILYLKVDDLKSVAKELEYEQASAEVNLVRYGKENPIRYQKELNQAVENHNKFYEFLGQNPELYKKIFPEIF